MRWFELIKGETLEEVHVRLTADGDHVGALKFVTNLRRSTWFGAGSGEVHKITAPHGCFIHMLHGECSKRWLRDGTCDRIGAYFVPRTLHCSPPSGCSYVGVSHAVGSEPITSSAYRFFNYRPEIVRAIVFVVGKRLLSISPLNAVEYERYLATRETLPTRHVCVVELLGEERITSVRAVFDGRYVTSVQIVTTRRTTEWFGPAPTNQVGH